MAYFKWHGIDLRGKTRRGMMFARSYEHLDNLLFKRDIALISCKQARIFFMRPVSLRMKIIFFKRLATLLKAGLLLPDAFSILTDSLEDIRLQQISSNIGLKLEGGSSLDEAFSLYPGLFSPLMINMAAVGKESGTLPFAFETLSSHLEAHHDFYKKIRAATIVPLFSFVLFLGIAFFIFIGIIPVFSQVFGSMGKQMPPLTQFFVSISDFLLSSTFMMMLVVFLSLIVFIYFFLGALRRKKMRDYIMVKLPVVKVVYVYSSIFTVFQSLSLLLKGGVQLVPALRISQMVVDNDVLKAQLSDIERAVESGSLLSSALMHYPGFFSRGDIIAMVATGEESSSLAPLFSTIADDYQERLEQKLSFYSMVFQPILMVILGILVTLLIVAVYGPILSLSDVIS